jgi:hypothetical protein
MDALARIAKKHGVKIFFLILVFGGAGYLIGSPQKYVGYKPDQPIPFSHKIHSGELGINCQFCHVNVERSQHATVPDTGTCMKCHEYVGSDSPHIQFLRKSYKDGKPVRWNKVHDLPDHVRFSHQVHIAKGFDCAQCHGKVENMEKLELHADFTMGWCVNCHREYTEQKHPAGNNRTVEITECSTCHK